MPNSKVSDIPSKTTTISDGSPEQLGSEPPRKHMKKYKHNWRINILATPKSRTEKYQYPTDTIDKIEKIETTEPPEVKEEPMEYKLSERIEHMSRPPIRTLVVNKRLFTPLKTEKYEKRMDEKIELSWNSMYNVYKKAKRDISRKSSEASSRSRSSRSSRGKVSPKTPTKGKKDKKEKSGKGDKKGKEKGKKKEKKAGGGAKTKEKTEEDIEREIQEWINSRAKPKPVFHPEPLPRGPIADLVELKDKIDNLATPKKAYTVEPKDPTIIADAALTYQATEKIVELAKPAPWKLIKEPPFIPGQVKPDALTYTATPRMSELAKPKVTQNAHDSDLKEDPFAISPNALKYVATPRIIELAKPLER